MKYIDIMGMCLKEFGPFSIEVRSYHDSFIIHFAESSVHPKDCRHPEFQLSELPNLMKALESAKEYVEEESR